LFNTPPKESFGPIVEGGAAKAVLPDAIILV